MKRQFSCRGKIIGCSAITRTLQRISSAFQAATVDHEIQGSWSHTGIVPVYDTFSAIAVHFHPEKVLESGEVHGGNVHEAARGKKINQGVWGILNLEQLQRKNDGFCPLCGARAASADLELGED